MSKLEILIDKSYLRESPSERDRLRKKAMDAAQWRRWALYAFNPVSPRWKCMRRGEAFQGCQFADETDNEDHERFSEGFNWGEWDYLLQHRHELMKKGRDPFRGCSQGVEWREPAWRRFYKRGIPSLVKDERMLQFLREMAQEQTP